MRKLARITGKFSTFMRLFFSIDAPDAIIEQFDRIAAKLGGGWKPTNPYQLHITLGFMGNVPDTEIERVIQAGETARKLTQQFRLDLGTIGYFPDFQRPRVLFANVYGDGVLEVLAHNFQKTLTGLVDSKGFKPHLTLARNRHGNGKPVSINLEGKWMVDHFFLKKSCLLQNQVKHDVVKRFDLAASDPGGR